MTEREVQPIIQLEIRAGMGDTPEIRMLAEALLAAVEEERAWEREADAGLDGREVMS